MRAYDPDVFSSLSTFPFARAQLAMMRGLIDDLGSLICKYDFHDILGISLLHKHFDLAEHEIIVRSATSDIAHMKPGRASEWREGCVPYLWRYVPQHAHPGWYPLEFIASDGIDASDLILLECADSLLEDLADKLVDLGLASTFGIAALFATRRLTVRAGQTLLETTDEINRTLTVEVIDEKNISTTDTTKTLWSFEKAHSQKGISNVGE